MDKNKKSVGRLNFNVSLELRQKIWLKCAENNITLKEYLTNLVIKDLEKK